LFAGSRAWPDADYLWEAGAEVLEGAATALLEAGAGLLVFFTFLTFLVEAGAVAVLPELFCPAGVEAGAWAANVKGMAATANPIANSVFFISFLPCGPAARSQFHVAAGRPETR
jgi:hypothetical protein